MTKQTTIVVIGSLRASGLSSRQWVSGKYLSYLFRNTKVLLMSTHTTGIGLDKSGYQVNSFLISQQKHMLWDSLEAPRQGASN